MKMKLVIENANCSTQKLVTKAFELANRIYNQAISCGSKIPKGAEILFTVKLGSFKIDPTEHDYVDTATCKLSLIFPMKTTDGQDIMVPVTEVGEILLHTNIEGSDYVRHDWHGAFSELDDNVVINIAQALMTGKYKDFHYRCNNVPSLT